MEAVRAPSPPKGGEGTGELAMNLRNALLRCLDILPNVGPVATQTLAPVIFGPPTGCHVPLFGSHPTLYPQEYQVPSRGKEGDS